MYTNYDACICLLLLCAKNKTDIKILLSLAIAYAKSIDMPKVLMSIAS